MKRLMHSPIRGSGRSHVIYIGAQDLIAVTDQRGQRTISLKIDDDAMPDQPGPGGGGLASRAAQDFRTWVGERLRDDFRLIVDHVDEQISFEELPAVSMADRRILIAKRLEQRFRDSLFRCYRVIGGSSRRSGNHQVAMMALKSGVDLSPWLDILLEQGARIRSMTSPTLLAWDVLARAAPQGSGLLVGVTPGGLRQMLVLEGRVRFTRLATVPRPTAEQVRDEVVRSLQYLTMQKEISRDTFRDRNFSIWVIDDGIQGARELPAQLPLETGDSVTVKLLDPADLGCPPLTDASGLALWGEACHWENRESDYATPRLRHTSRIHQWQQRIWIMGTGILATGSMMAGLASPMVLWNLPDPGPLNLASQAVSVQRDTLNEALSIYPASASEMHSVVESTERLRQRRFDTERLLAGLSRAFDDESPLELEGLSWFPADQAQQQDTPVDITSDPTPALDESSSGTALLSPLVVVVSGSVDHTLGKSEANRLTKSLATRLGTHCECDILSTALPYDPAPHVGLTPVSADSENKRLPFSIVLQRAIRPIDRTGQTPVTGSPT